MSTDERHAIQKALELCVIDENRKPVILKPASESGSALSWRRAAFYKELLPLRLSDHCRGEFYVPLRRIFGSFFEKAIELPLAAYEVDTECVAHALSLICREHQPEILDLLSRVKNEQQSPAHAEAASSPKAKSKSPKRRGRPKGATTDERSDRKTYEAWKSGRHRYKKDLAVEFKVTEEEVHQAIDRVRRRKERLGQK